MSEDKKSGGFGKWLKRLLWLLVGIVGFLFYKISTKKSTAKKKTTKGSTVKKKK